MNRVTFGGQSTSFAFPPTAKPTGPAEVPGTERRARRRHGARVGRRSGAAGAALAPAGGPGRREECGHTPAGAVSSGRRPRWARTYSRVRPGSTSSTASPVATRTVARVPDGDAAAETVKLVGST